MAAPSVKFDVSGLVRLARDFKELEDLEGAAEFKAGLLAAAGIVSDEAKLRANSFSFRASDAIRPMASSGRAYVVGGKASLPWYGWADFGSRTPRKGQRRSVGPWKGSGKGPKGGRFIYPAIAAKSDEVAEAVGDAFDRAKSKLGGF